MIFNDRLVELESIKNAEQAQAIEDFLEAEQRRHSRERSLFDDSALVWLGLAVDGDLAHSYDYRVTRAVMDMSASLRHLEDEGATSRKRTKLRDRWGLEDKCHS